MAATIKDFLTEKKELILKIKHINKLCDNDSEETIKRELLFIKQKVVDLNRTITRFLNIIENLEIEPLSKMKDGLQELIIKLETSVCVPEFCINADIHNSCQNLTKKLIENFKEVLFYYNLSQTPRASNKRMRRRSIKANTYVSVAPNSELIKESVKRKKSIKCKRKAAEAESHSAKTILNSSQIKKIGRFEIVSHVAENTTAATGKKKKKSKTVKKPSSSKKRKKKNTKQKII